ncbi:hypothetical protein DYB38_011684, partial [Aphanomyces astaci]
MSNHIAKCLNKVKQADLAEVQSEFAAEFRCEYIAYGKDCVYNVDETDIYYDMPPRYIWAVRGGSSKISSGEKHSLRMTAVLTVRPDGTKLPILFIMKGVPGGRIESGELATFPSGHHYDGTKLPILFIMKGVPGGRIESGELATFPSGHHYA